MAVGDFRLDHPELGEMAARLRFLRAERRPEAVDLAQRHRGRFNVELARLREVSLLFEVVDRKQCGGAFACGRSKDRRIGESESAIVEVVACRLDDLGANPQDRRLPRRAQPEMAMLHQELDAVLLGRDGIRIVRIDALQNLRIADVHLVAAGSALVGAHLAGDDHAGFLGQALDRLEQFGRDRVLGDDALDDAAAVAENGEQQFAALAQVVEPAANGDGLTFVLANFANGGDWSFGFDFRG